MSIECLTVRKTIFFVRLCNQVLEWSAGGLMTERSSVRFRLVAFLLHERLYGEDPFFKYTQLFQWHSDWHYTFNKDLNPIPSHIFLELELALYTHPNDTEENATQEGKVRMHTTRIYWFILPSMQRKTRAIKKCSFRGDLYLKFSMHPRAPEDSTRCLSSEQVGGFWCGQVKS